MLNKLHLLILIYIVLFLEYVIACLSYALNMADGIKLLMMFFHNYPLYLLPRPLEPLAAGALSGNESTYDK